MPMGISKREFARLDGCSDTLVRRAIDQGRLKAYEDGTLNPADVGSPWRLSNATGANAANTVRAKPATIAGQAERGDDETAEEAAERILAARGATLSYNNAIRVKENYIALLRQLEYEEKSGNLIEVAAAEKVLFEEFRAVRDAWLNWPVRVGPLLAADFNLPADRVTEALTKHVHEHLVGLGEPEVVLGAES